MSKELTIVDLKNMTEGEFAQTVLYNFNSDLEIRAEFADVSRFQGYLKACMKNGEPFARLRRPDSDLTAAIMRNKNLSGLTPIEARAKTNWRASAEIRREFGGSFGRYLAYMRAHEKHGNPTCGKKVPALDTGLTQFECSVGQQNLAVELRAKRAWDTSHELRQEFGQNFQAYLSYRRANERADAVR